MKFTPNKYGYAIIGIVSVLILVLAFKKRKSIMNSIYAHLLDENGKFKVNRSAPRGQRNNNPGNLIKTNIKWRGKVEFDRNSDGHFEQFYEMKFGVRALIKDLLNDIKKGKNTLPKLISEFAPAHENNTSGYIQRVSRMTGIAINEIIKPSASNIEALVRAIIQVENGKQFITSIIIAHNHPSGSLKPSTQDINITKKVKESGKTMDIQVLDHIIITKESHFSFADEGIL